MTPPSRRDLKWGGGWPGGVTMFVVEVLLVLTVIGVALLLSTALLAVL